MKRFSILLFFCCASSVFAEHTEHRNQIYNEKSALTVDSINKITEVLRNPTVMSGNFREALKRISPSIPVVSAATLNSSSKEEDDMPFIELVAKIIAKDKPSTVVLRVNDHTVHLSEGSKVSQLVNRKIVNIRVDKVTENDVTIFLMPFGQAMVLQ